jgi:uncharacterized membrane protein YjgN (DUF898 family)
MDIMSLFAISWVHMLGSNDSWMLDGLLPAIIVVFVVIVVVVLVVMEHFPRIFDWTDDGRHDVQEESDKSVFLKNFSCLLITLLSVTGNNIAVSSSYLLIKNHE